MEKIDNDEEEYPANVKIVSQKDFNELKARLFGPNEILEPVYIEEGGGTMNKSLFNDDEYKVLNKGSFIFIFLVSEALKEINEGEFSVNSDKFTPDTKQTNILNLVKDRFKKYIENYKKYPVAELKMKLNLLCLDFLKLLNKETIQTIYKTLLKNIYEQRKKQLKKNIEDYKKYYEEEVINTIETNEAEELAEKLCRPVKELFKSLLSSNIEKKIDLNATLNKNALKKSFTFNNKRLINTINKNDMKALDKINNEVLKSSELTEYYNKYDDKITRKEIKIEVDKLKEYVDKYRDVLKNLQLSTDKYDKINYYNQLLDIKRKILEQDINIGKLIGETKMDLFDKKNGDKIDMIKKFEDDVLTINNYYNSDVYRVDKLKEMHELLQEVKKKKEDYMTIFKDFTLFNLKQQESIKKTYNIFNKDINIMFGLKDFSDELERKEINIFLRLGVLLLYMLSLTKNKEWNGYNPKENIKYFNVEDFTNDEIKRDEDKAGLDTTASLDELLEEHLFNLYCSHYYSILNIIKDNKYINEKIDNREIYDENVLKDIGENDLIDLINSGYDTYANIMKSFEKKNKDEEKKEDKKEDDTEDVKTEGDVANQINSILGNLDNDDKDKKDDKINGVGKKSFKTKGGVISPFSKNKDFKININPRIKDIEILKKGGNIQEKLKKYNPSFNPPTRPKKDMINNVNNKRKIRDARITNYTRSKIENNINNLNNSTDLYNNINNINPDLINVLSKPQGGGTFFTKKVNKIINSIKQDAKKI